MERLQAALTGAEEEALSWRKAAKEEAAAGEGVVAELEAALTQVKITEQLCGRQMVLSSMPRWVVGGGEEKGGRGEGGMLTSAILRKWRV